MPNNRFEVSLAVALDPLDKTPSISVWIKSLGWQSLFTLCSLRAKHGKFSLHTTEFGIGGQTLAKIIQAIGLITGSVQHVQLTDHGQRVDDSQSPTFLIQSRINQFTAEFLSDHELIFQRLTKIEQSSRPKASLANLRKAAAQLTYDLLLLVEFARYQNKINGITPRRLVVISADAVLANSVSQGWCGDDVEFYPLWDPSNSSLLHLARGVQRWLVNSIRWKRSKDPSLARIGAEAACGIDPSSVLSDLFWWWDSGIPSQRIVLYFDRADAPASNEVVTRAAELGIKCVVMNQQATGDFPQLLWKAAPGPIISSARLWRKFKIFLWSIPQGIVGSWAARQVLSSLHHSEPFQDLMEDFNIRALFHYQDSWQDYLSPACEAVNGARIGHHWSNHHWPSAFHVRIQQVYFTWGQHCAEILNAIGSEVNHVLMSGCVVPWSHPMNDTVPEVDYRALVTSTGATRVLALFDTSLPCEGFYEFFLRKIADDQRWGLLIKPKSYDSPPWVLQNLPELDNLYDRLSTGGRICMLDPQISPGEVATGADFSVGVDVNSATVIVALSNRRAIHLDYARLHDSPLSDWAAFHKYGPDRLVFDDPEKLWTELNYFFDRPGSNPTLGIADETLLHQIDPIRDGLAGSRIGEYLKWYLEGLDQQMDRDAALANATRIYSDKWGSEMVAKSHDTIP